MKLIKPITSLFFFCVVTIKIFCQANTILNYLPTDAKMIIKINPASLGKKIKWDELMKYKMFEDVLRKTPEQGKEFLDNPSHTGIDLSKGFFVVIPANKNQKKSQPVFFAIPKDTAQVTLMVKKLNPEKKIAKVGNGKLMINNNAAIAWNHDIFVLTGYDSTERMGHENTGGQLSAESMKVKQLTEKCKSLLTKRQKAFSNEQFLSLLSEQGDVLFWTDNTLQSQPQKNNKAMDAIAMMNKSLMRKGNYSSGILNFENGRVVANMKQHLPASLDSIYKKYPLKNLNTALVQKLPIAHPLVLCSFSISPEMLLDNLATSGADKMLDSMSKQKTKIEDLLPAIKGDFTMAVLKTDDVAQDDSFTKNMNGLQVFLAGTINDKEKFKNLRTLIEGKKDSTTNAKKPKPVVLSNDSIFVVSLSPIAAEKFVASAGTNAEMGKLVEPYKNYPSAVVIDLKTVLGLVMPPMARGKSEEQAKQASEVLGTFDKMVGYGGQHDNNSISSTLELVLVNKDENSLKQFLNLIDLFYSMKHKGSAAYNDRAQRNY